MVNFRHGVARGRSYSDSEFPMKKDNRFHLSEAIFCFVLFCFFMSKYNWEKSDDWETKKLGFYKIQHLLPVTTDS